jgi:hypothetical protein
VLLGASLLGACSSERAPAADSARSVADSTAPNAVAPSSAPASSTGSAASPSSWTVSLAGLGPIRAGQSLAAVGTTLGEQFHTAGKGREACDHVHSAKLPVGVKLMVQGDTVVRVEIDSATVRTAEGARVGDTEQSVLAMYKGRVTTQPHKYTGPTGHYLVVDDPADPQHRIVFETDGARVTTYRAGNRAAVDLVEGCS